MSRHRFVAPVLTVSVLVALACSGFPGKRGKRGGDLRVGATSIERQATRLKGPRAASVEQRRKKDEYTVKLAPGVEGLKVGKRFATGNAALDGSIGNLSVSSSGYVHANHTPKNARVAEVLGLGRTIHIRTSKDPEQVIARLSAHPDVEWVEPVTEVRSGGRDEKAGKAGKAGKKGKKGKKGKGGKSGKGANGSAPVGGGATVGTGDAPNDPYWQYQWHLQNLRVQDAWTVTQGEGVVVAVIDTGVSKNEDGFHKLLPGYDFVDNDSDASDLNGHGTHVAGTIGQRSDNGIGVAGVAPKVTILPVRVLDANGAGSNTWVANGILWAVDNGADIINLSLGSPTNSEVVSDACAYAYEQGVTVIAATGNDGFTDHIGYPAALDTTIAVGSVDPDSDIAFYSNQGRQIDIVAPGGDTTTDSNNDGMQDGVVQETIMNGQWSYYFLQGTSMATPHVAGVAALIHANGVHDPDQIRSVLNASAQDLGKSGWDTTFGHGMVDPVAALGATPSAPSASGRLIAKHRVKEMQGNRAVIGWITTEPAETFVNGSNDFDMADDTPTKIHKVTVRGDPGEQVSFTFGSSVGDQRDTEQVTITF